MLTLASSTFDRITDISCCMRTVLASKSACSKASFSTKAAFDAWHRCNWLESVCLSRARLCREFWCCMRYMTNILHLIVIRSSICIYKTGIIFFFLNANSTIHNTRAFADGIYFDLMHKKCLNNITEYARLLWLTTIMFLNNLPSSYPPRISIAAALPWWRSTHLARSLESYR